MLQIEPALFGPYLLIGAFEHREVEIVLLADVIIQHALVGAGFRRDAVDARAGEAMGGKFLLGGLENAKPHALGVALPLQNSLCLGQISRSVMAEGPDVTRAGRFENELGASCLLPFVGKGKKENYPCRAVRSSSRVRMPQV